MILHGKTSLAKAFPQCSEFTKPDRQTDQEREKSRRDQEKRGQGQEDPNIVAKISSSYII